MGTIQLCTTLDWFFVVVILVLGGGGGVLFFVGFFFQAATAVAKSAQEWFNTIICCLPGWLIPPSEETSLLCSPRKIGKREHSGSRSKSYPASLKYIEDGSSLSFY